MTQGPPINSARINSARINSARINSAPVINARSIGQRGTTTLVHSRSRSPSEKPRIATPVSAVIAVGSATSSSVAAAISDGSKSG